MARLRDLKVNDVIMINEWLNWGEKKFPVSTKWISEVAIVREIKDGKIYSESGNSGVGYLYPREVTIVGNVR